MQATHCSIDIHSTIQDLLFQTPHCTRVTKSSLSALISHTLPKKTCANLEMSKLRLCSSPVLNKANRYIQGGRSKVPFFHPKLITREAQPSSVAKVRATREQEGKDERDFGLLSPDASLGIKQSKKSTVRKKCCGSLRESTRLCKERR
jgi:hypothetical protein